MSTTGQDQAPLDHVRVADREQFQDGPPHELFRRLRARVPGALDRRISEFPEEDGFWSVTTADDVHAVSRDWETYSSERRRHHGARRTRSCRSSCSRRCSSAWTRPSTTGSRRCSSAASRRSGSPSTRTRSARSRSTCSTRLEGARTCDLVDRRRPAGRRARDRQLHGPAARGRRGLGEADEHDPRRRRPGRDARGRRERDGARRARGVRALRRS